jgi:hypothetical protein
MPDVNLGIVIVLITAFGYASNFLNWRYLNYGVVRWMYYLGALVHETSHAIVAILIGAKIKEFKVFSKQPRVIHQRSRLPLLGEFLISVAPIAGGLLFLFLVNHYLLGDYFAPPQPSSWTNWQNVLIEPMKLLAQINLLHWQSWVIVFLSFNIGSMIGPSTQDLKNGWPVLLILFFIRAPIFTAFCFAALSLIFANIALQIIVIVVMKAASLVRGR